MPYIEKRIKSGKLLEIERYYAARNGAKLSRKENENESDDLQQDLNTRNARKRLVRLINANFSKEAGDLFMTLTYKNAATEAEAKKQVRNYMRRIRTYRKREGLPELQYIIITEQGKGGRWHHHIIMSGMDRDAAEVIWKAGRARSSRLDDTYSFRDLAGYLVKEADPKDPEDHREPRRKYTRRWIPSKNLKQPIETKKEIKRETVLQRAPKAPKGYTLLPDWSMGCDAYGNYYQYFSCVRDEIRPETEKQGKTRKSRKEKRE